MVRAWYISDNADIEKKEDCHLDPPQYVGVEDLTALTGVKYFKLQTDKVDDDPQLEKIKSELGVTWHDFLEIDDSKFPKEKLDRFYSEHKHADEEIRAALDGSGFFDLRDKDDRWIRVHIEKGDLLVLPKSINHRFTTGKENYVNLIRLFTAGTEWQATFRHADKK